MTKAEPVAGSFRDPSGFVFHRDGVLYRQVNPVYADDFERLKESGLYEALTAKRLLVPHDEVPDAEPAAPGAYKILRPTELEFISYPWEWCFSQLKAGALATLRIQELAIEYGMSLKDASAFNIQFHAGKPLFIDTLSFETYREGQPWVAYRQFCQHFLAPLAVMAYTDHRLGRILRTFIDGLPLDLASRMLPKKTRFKLGLMTHLHLQAKAEASLSSESGRASKQRVHKVSKRGLLGILDSLKGVVKGLRWKPTGTTWADYYSETNYSDEGRGDKHEQVARMVGAVAPRTVWDLGANTGVFSEIAAETAQLTLSFDMDEAAVERNYLRCIERGSAGVLPLVLDLANPSPGVGWASRERLPLLERGRPDLVLALALIHHLAIGNNLPLGHVADYLREISPNLVIEFVPKSDSQVQRMLATREDIFAGYHQEAFEQAFGERFQIRDSVKLRDTERTLYLLSAT